MIKDLGNKHDRQGSTYPLSGDRSGDRALVQSQRVANINGIAAVFLSVCVCMHSNRVTASDVSQTGEAVANVLENKRLFFTPVERVNRQRLTDVEVNSDSADSFENTNTHSLANPSAESKGTHERESKTTRVNTSTLQQRKHGIHYQARLAVGDALYFVINDIPCEPFSIKRAERGPQARLLSCHELNRTGYQLTVSKEAHSLSVVKGSTRIGTILPGQSL